MVEASWIYAAGGGAMIGLSAGGLMILNGRTAGVSGILHLAVGAGRDPWRWSFLIGLVSAGVIASMVVPGALPSGAKIGNVWLLVPAGLLVGFGTRMSGGCTSGHGICGLSRFSLRSLVAVLVFMGCGMVTVAIMRVSGVLV